MHSCYELIKPMTSIYTVCEQLRRHRLLVHMLARSKDLPVYLVHALHISHVSILKAVLYIHYILAIANNIGIRNVSKLKHLSMYFPTTTPQAQVGGLTANLCPILTYYSYLIKHCDVRSPIVGDLIFMVGNLTKADCPTMGHLTI